MKIKVTQEHIDRANAARKVAGANHGATACNFCPIAQAVRELPGLERARVGTVISAPAHYAHLPKEALDFTVRYDGGDAVAPIEFEVELLERGQWM